MESDRRYSFLFGRIFFDEPVSTSSETLAAALRSLKSARFLTVFIALMRVSIATMRLRALWGR